MNRIPKKLHMYWDKSSMSRLQVFTIETFHKLNPDWEIHVYTPIQEYTSNEHYVLDYKGKDFFHLIKKMDYVNIKGIDITNYNISNDIHNILRSDIFRCHILYEQGGMWSDFDVIWLKPISHMNNIKHVGNIQEMGASIHFYNTTEGHIGVGILFSTPKHDLYRVLIDKTIGVMKRKKHLHQDFGSVMWSEVYKTLEIALKSHPDLVSIPYETFAPYGIWNLDSLYNKVKLSLINDNVIGLHWFNGHKLSKNYINRNLFSKGSRCSMTSILTELGFDT